MRQKNLSSQVLSVSYNGTLFKSLRGVYVIISFFSYTVPTTTVQTAKFMDIASSPQAYTVHKDVTERLETINKTLARQARKVLDINKSERHIRGGMATKEKYLHNK